MADSTFERNQPWRFFAQESIKVTVHGHGTFLFIFTLPLNSSKKCPMPVKGYKVWKGQRVFAMSDSLGISCRFLAKRSDRKLRLFDRA
jgi:hypothetical protein